MPTTAERLTEIETAIRAVLDNASLADDDGAVLTWSTWAGPPMDMPKASGPACVQATLRFRTLQYGRPGQPISNPEACMNSSRFSYSVWEARLVRCIPRTTEGVAKPAALAVKLRNDQAAVRDKLDGAVFGGTLDVGEHQPGWFTISDLDDDGVPFDGFTVTIEVPL